MNRQSIYAGLGWAFVIAFGSSPSMGDEISAPARTAGALLTGPPTTFDLGGGLDRPRLYDNTMICTANTHALPVGGKTPNGMTVRDWFTTSGGPIAGFDVFVMNGKTTSLGGESITQPLQIQFYADTDSQVLGDSLGPAGLFRTVGGPVLDRIPAWFDPNTSLPGLMRVSVDYIDKTYNVVGLYEDPPGSGVTAEVQLNPVNQYIGDSIGRRPITLPAGKIGVDVRLSQELSICNDGDPKAGVVLAAGGGGSINALHIVGLIDDGNPPSEPSSACQPHEYPAMCDDPGWRPFEEFYCQQNTDCEGIFGPGAICDVSYGICVDRVLVPCTGGNACGLDLPYYGIALTLYGGSNEDEDGNNEVSTADLLDPGQPSPCTAGRVSATGFLGDNGSSIGPGTPFGLFDADADEDVDLLDWGDFQRCFGRTDDPTCTVHDQNENGDIDLIDYGGVGSDPGFVGCLTGDITSPDFEPIGAECIGEIPNDPIILQDVDIFEINAAPDFVLSVLVEGATDGFGVPLWDPHFRVFQLVGEQIEELARSDDFNRFSRDGFTTVQLPHEPGPVYVGISSATHANYDPLNPETIAIINAEEAGAYTLTVALTNPECVEDDQSGAPTDCYETKHEPDDTFAQADARGDAPGKIIRGAIGDGAFAGLGQDVDIHRISLSGDIAAARSLTARITSDAKTGFTTVFDLAMALYDSTGALIACGDQASTSAFNGLDQSRPQLAANVDGTDLGGDGVYYLAVFGTDRILFDEDDDAMFPPAPPTIVSFPRTPGLAGTNESDLRAVVGGRVNIPGTSLSGPPPLSGPYPMTQTLQCYELVFLPSQGRLATTATDDIDELASPHGNDSISDASASVAASDSLATAQIEHRVLGNGHFGGWQGDVDFYRVDAQPGQLVVVNTADAEQPPKSDHPVRTYLALLDSTGNVFATHDYSHESFWAIFGASDDVADEVAATIVGVVPPENDGPVYAMVGIDNGNLLLRENIPFDPFRPGTTLSRRFETSVWRAREYGIGISILDAPDPIASDRRMFAVAHRGIDDLHTATFVTDPEQSTGALFPPILEVAPSTGHAIAVLNGAPTFSTFRSPGFPECVLGGCPTEVSSNPAIAYDGQSLFVTVEECIGANCSATSHPLFRIDPTLSPGDAGFTISMGNIEPPLFDTTFTGMVEKDGFLYVLGATSNRLRFWDKDLPPVATVGGMSEDLTLLSGTDPAGTEFDDLDGDMGTDGSYLYIGCSNGGAPAGICRFTATPSPDGSSATFTFEGAVADPITNNGLVPGPRLGGLDFSGSNLLITTDRNGPIVEHVDMSTGHVTGFELPPGYVIDRLTVR